MPISQFPFGSATALVRALRQRKVSSLDLLNAYLARIDKVNPAINAVVVQDRRAARAQVPEHRHCRRCLPFPPLQARALRRAHESPPTRPT